jgi:signal transduction histidine kinase
MMSIRRRLFALLLVSCVALGASVLGTLRLTSLGASAREATAATAGSRAMLVLAHRLDEGLDPAEPATAALLEDLSRTLEDGTVGVCSVDGTILVQKTMLGPLRPPGAPEMLPLDREQVVRACRAAVNRPQTARGLAPNDVLTVATFRSGAGPVAFALARVPRWFERASPVSLALLALAGATTAVLLALTAHASWVLRASTESLQVSLDALQRDLRAPIAEPRAVELARVARHLRALASTLADAQERERTLSRASEEQTRLAGLGRVVAGVAHEVRNPLAGIKLRLDSMALRPLDARTHVDVVKSLREVGRLDRLVRTLLLMSRDRTPQRVPFDAGPMVDERIALAEPLAQAGGVQIDREGDATIVGEREELCGVLDNLVRNAIEASPPGARVRVRLLEDAGAARIEVIDEGQGIPPDRLGELFEPFFTTKGSGTGLGLVLARTTVEAHGGRLRYERRADRTLFSLSIPHAAEAGASHA